MAAKDGLEVTGVDIASNLVERARARAEAAGSGLDSRKPMPRLFRLTMRVRCGDEPNRRHVRAATGSRRKGAAARMQARWNHCHGELDAAGIRRTVVQEPCRNSLRHPACPRRSCGAMKRRFVNGSGRDSRIYAWSGATIRSRILFRRPPWWSSSGSTMDLFIKRLRPLTPMGGTHFARNSKRSGQRTTAQGWTAPPCLLNIWKLSAFEHRCCGDATRCRVNGKHCSSQKRRPSCTT